MMMTNNVRKALKRASRSSFEGVFAVILFKGINAELVFDDVVFNVFLLFVIMTFIMFGCEYNRIRKETKKEVTEEQIERHLDEFNL